MDKLKLLLTTLENLAEKPEPRTHLHAYWEKHGVPRARPARVEMRRCPLVCFIGVTRNI